MTKQTMVLIVLFVFVLIRGLFIEPNTLEVTKYTVSDKYLHGVRVAFLSDFHLKRRDYKRLDKIINLTNRQNPDLILLGGDFANNYVGGNTMTPDIMAQKLSLLNAPAYSVLGTSDWKVADEKVQATSLGQNEIAKALEKNGIKVLENQSKRIILKNRYVDIIGLADYNSRTINVGAAFRKTILPRLVLTHNPDAYYDITPNVSLIFAGHTHGGQFVLPFLRPLFVPSKYGAEFASGMTKSNKNQMVISKGLGTSIIPFRFNCKPEIVIIDFVRK
ncbi:metallophosphoesterase [bacterium]|nr:metallophosphoesterase [bacterium]MBQ9150052.1 metallophosphoesterase [bacterium]